MTKVLVDKQLLVDLLLHLSGHPLKKDVKQRLTAVVHPRRRPEVRPCACFKCVNVIGVVAGYENATHAEVGAWKELVRRPDIVKHMTNKTMSVQGLMRKYRLTRARIYQIVEGK